MTANSRLCEACKRYGVAEVVCDGCGKAIVDDAPHWIVNARWIDDGEQRHACSNNCLEKALESAGWHDGDDSSERQLACLEWQGSPGDAFVLVRQVSSQSKA